MSREEIIIETRQSSLECITQNDVHECLKMVRTSIKKGRFRISIGREENIDFFSTYLCDETMAAEICKNLTYLDFSKAELSRNIYNYGHILYFFGKKDTFMKKIDDGNENVEVELYIKLDVRKNNTVCVSFHEAKYPIRYAFK